MDLPRVVKSVVSNKKSAWCVSVVTNSTTLLQSFKFKDLIESGDGFIIYYAQILIMDYLLKMKDVADVPLVKAVVLCEDFNRVELGRWLANLLDQVLDLPIDFLLRLEHLGFILSITVNPLLAHVH